MDLRTYRTLLSSNGKSLAEVKKQQSNQIINNTFTSDPNYKRVYILTKDGWKFEDAKYQFHTAKSILRDDVDYYLQFRPKVHYPIGSYVIVPDDTSPDINLTAKELRNPFEQPIKKRTQWWMIVNRDNANAFVRYNILPCNWNFQWMWEGKIQNCFGAIRNANSYTSGVWRDEISASLDNLTGAWMPDIYHVYGDKYAELGMDDNRTIMHEQRFMITNNLLDPKVYQVTKIVDLSPQGIIKISIKQDECNYTRDNVELRICDYYTNAGENKTEENESYDTSYHGTSEIKWMYINDNEELDYANESFDKKLHIGAFSYFKVIFSSSKINAHWHLTYLGNEEDKTYYEGLLKMEEINSTVLSIKPGKANSLIGKQFKLAVSDDSGNYYSSINLEVVE